MITLHHNRVELALHELRTSDGPRLLLLHGLGEQSPTSVPEWAESWPGAVWALDFTGHGQSTMPLGGGYTAEVLMGDVDAALEHLGSATVLGRGIGGYVALLIAGARADAVRGAIIADGPGLFGGPSGPTSPALVIVPPGVSGPTVRKSVSVHAAMFSPCVPQMAVMDSGPVTILLSALIEVCPQTGTPGVRAAAVSASFSRRTFAWLNCPFATAGSETKSTSVSRSPFRP